jgi:hypothetical protein
MNRIVPGDQRVLPWAFTGRPDSEVFLGANDLVVYSDRELLLRVLAYAGYTGPIVDASV